MADSTPDMDQDEDPSEQAAWEIATAETLRARGELADAASWYRRAANHLMEAGDDERAIEVAKLAAELVALESAVRPASVRQSGESHSAAPAALATPAPLSPAAISQDAAAQKASAPLNASQPSAPTLAPTGQGSALGAGRAKSTASVRSQTAAQPKTSSSVGGAKSSGPGGVDKTATAPTKSGLSANSATKSAAPLGANASVSLSSFPTPALGAPRPSAQVPAPTKLTGSVPAPRPPTTKPTGSSIAPVGLLLPSAPPSQDLPQEKDGRDGEPEATSIISLPMIASPIASMLDEAVATIPREGQSVLPSAHKRPLSFRPERAAEGESIAARLSALPLFSELPTDRLRSVARQLIVETRDADESLCESGAPEGPLYVILSGTAWVGLAGRASPVALVSAGDVVGEIAALYGGPRTATIIAREPIETVAIAPSIVRAMAREFAGFRESLLESITERMRESLPEIAPCMRRLSADARRELMDLAVFVEIAEGEELIIEGEPAPALFVVAAGEAECFGGELGVRHAVRVRVGEMMGAASVLESVPAGVTARASRALLIAKMQADAVQKLMPAHASLRELLEDVTNPGKGVVC